MFSRSIKRNVTKPLECQVSDIHVQVIQASCNMSSGGGLKNREEQSKKLRFKMEDGVGKESLPRARRTALKMKTKAGTGSGK